MTLVDLDEKDIKNRYLCTFYKNKHVSHFKTSQLAGN